MEKDFMGLTHVKQEIPEEKEPINSAPLRSAAMHWPFSSKGPGAVPQLLSLQGESPKIGFDSLVSTGLVSLTTTEGFDFDHKAYAGVQKGIDHDQKQDYPAKHAVHCMAAAQTSAAISLASGQNLIGSVGLNAKPLAGVPLMRNLNPPKVSGGPAQLTIFYNGSVCVYDNILPEKVEAIMFLAGNGLSLASSATATTPAQASVPVPSTLENFATTQPYGASLHHSTPVSVTSSTAKPAGVLLSSSKFAKPLKLGSAVGPVSSTFLSLATVPQFRRKSLARFLEKRRERVMITASPYGGEKRAPDCSLSMNSSGSCAVPATN